MGCDDGKVWKHKSLDQFPVDKPIAIVLLDEPEPDGEVFTGIYYRHAATLDHPAGLWPCRTVDPTTGQHYLDVVDAWAAQAIRKGIYFLDKRRTT